MPSVQPVSSARSAGTDASFTEAPAWRSVGQGWRPLFGNFRPLGFSFEWHEFTSPEDLDWARSFHPGSVELCLNLDGQATLRNGKERVEVRPRTSVFYVQGEPPLQANRHAGEAHRFISVEFARAFLKQHLAAEACHLHPAVCAVLKRTTPRSVVSTPEPLNAMVLQLVESLRHCPVYKPAQAMWFRCKALELAAQAFFRPPEGELLCTRQQRAACERAGRVREILSERLAEPPALEELGRLVGCSPFHLSRQFSKTTGLTIQQFIRQLRLERAAELLRAGKRNVTEAALEVGYNSLSHFTVAFREMFGCCPGLYPLKPLSEPARPKEGDFSQRPENR